MTPEETLNRLEQSAPPQNVDAEKGVLGSCLIDPEKLDDVALVIRDRDFRTPSYRVIFRAMLDVYEAGKRPDHVLVFDRLKKTGKADEAGGISALAELADFVPTAHNAVYYAELVRDCSILRDVIEAGVTIVKMGQRFSSEDPRELISKAEAAVFGILDQRETRDALPIRDVLFEAMVEMGRRFEAKEQAGLRFGFSDLDNLLGGIRGGELAILAARPGMGKSALATNIAEKVSLEQEKGVLFFSLEMNRLELADRIICGRARVDSRKARNGMIDPEERSRLVEQSNRFSPAPLFIDDTPGRNMAEISAVCRRQKRRSKLDLVIVDYLQRVTPDDSRTPREQQVATIATRLKTLARELNVPVLCLAQLNRQVESQLDKTPKLSHLRESGAIEQEADQVWFVHRADYYEHDATKHTGIAEVFVEKNRAGATGKASLKWFGEWTRFATLAPEDCPEQRQERPQRRAAERRPEPAPTPKRGRAFNPSDWGQGDDDEAA